MSSEPLWRQCATWLHKLRKQNIFIAVGFFHLRKKCGILEQLKEQGFKIEPIKIKPVANTVYN